MSDTVTLTFAAQTRNVSLARTLAAAMSARADMPLDQLEDVRLAIDEAVSQVIWDAPPGADITCSFTVVGDALDIIVTGPSVSGQPPESGTFSWIVMTALVDTVTARTDGDSVSIRLFVARHAAVDA